MDSVEARCFHLLFRLPRTFAETDAAALTELLDAGLLLAGDFF